MYTVRVSPIRKKPSATRKNPSVPRLAFVKGHRREVLQIAARRGGANVRLFGSVLRGDDTQDSDIDLLISFRPGTSIFDRGGLLMELREALGCPVDVVSDKTIHPSIRKSVLASAVPL